MLFSQEALANCNERIIERVPPNWVFHTERILQKHGKCIITVYYDLTSEGAVTVKSSNFPIQECGIYKKSAENSVSKYTFKSGENESCSVNVTFQLDE